jgi:hypothetical protein
MVSGCFTSLGDDFSIGDSNQGLKGSKNAWPGSWWRASTPPRLPNGCSRSSCNRSVMKEVPDDIPELYRLIKPEGVKSTERKSPTLRRSSSRSERLSCRLASVTLHGLFLPENGQLAWPKFFCKNPLTIDGNSIRFPPRRAIAATEKK